MNRRPGFWLASTVFLVSLNLRGSVVAISPVLDTVRQDTGLSAAAAGLLASVPLLCWGLFASPAPRLARRFGVERTITAAMVLLTTGILMRLATPVTALFAGTIVLGLAIAVCNVLVPALIKRDFADDVGAMTGLYVTALACGAALAAGLTAPLSNATGLSWRPTLALWAIPALLAAAAMVPYLRRGERAAGSHGLQQVRGLWRDRVAWQVAAFMGMQSLSFYACAAWLPSIFLDGGMSTGASGVLLAVFAVVGIPVSLVVPVLAARRRTQRRYVVGSTVVCAAGLIGMVVAPTGPAIVWMVLVGVGQGATLGLAFAFFALRARDSAHAAELSGMAQTFGYLLAALGPLVVGGLHDLAGGWTLPLGVLSALLIPQLLAGLGAARDVYVGRPVAPAA